MNEIVFEIAFSGIENQFRASGRNAPLHVEAPSLEKLERKMCDAVRSHFAGQSDLPKQIVAVVGGKEFTRISLE